MINKNLTPTLLPLISSKDYLLTRFPKIKVNIERFEAYTFVFCYLDCIIKVADGGLEDFMTKKML